MSEWKKVKLTDLTDYRTDKIESHSLNTKNYISTDNLLVDREGIIDSVYVPESGRFNAYKNKDILISNIRPYFKKIWFANKDGGCSNDILVFPTNNEEIDPKFLYYQLSKNDFFDYMMSGANGTKMPRGNKKSILHYSFDLPPLSTQKKISKILSNYDDLIENNLKRIKLLEESARLTYEEWFLRFKIDGKKLEIDSETGLPFGWEKKRSDHVLDVNIGKTPPRGEVEWFTKNNKGIKWISIKDMKKSRTYIFKTNEEITMEGVSKFNMNIAKKDTVILSFKLTVGEVRIVTEDMVTNEAIAHMNIKNDSILFKEYIFLYLKSFNFDTLGSTSSIGTAINSKIVKAMPITIPSIEVMKEFKTVINPLFGSIENLQKQNQLLKEARDILLPRLMTGIINVDNMEVAV